MLFLRIFQHLLPDAAAWRLTITKTLRKFFEGLAQSFAAARTFIDQVHADRLPATTRELAAWERQFGVTARGTEADRRLQLDGEWKAQGGQSPRYLQDVMQAAGFNVFIHEWWEGPNVAPRTARDPRDYTVAPLFGQTQCGQTKAQCGRAGEICDRFLVNETNYLVNHNMLPVAPPSIPSNPDTWPYFLYWGGEVFGQPAVIDAARKEEFKRLLLKICPAHLWLVTIVIYEEGYVPGLFYFGGGDGFGEGAWSTGA
jgi:hypothetical protein